MTAKLLLVSNGILFLSGTNTQENTYIIRIALTTCSYKNLVILTSVADTFLETAKLLLVSNGLLFLSRTPYPLDPLFLKQQYLLGLQPRPLTNYIVYGIYILSVSSLTVEGKQKMVLLYGHGHGRRIRMHIPKMVCSLCQLVLGLLRIQ